MPLDANRSATGRVAGVFEAIVGAMRRYEGVAKVQEHGCLALGNLAWNNGAWRTWHVALHTARLSHVLTACWRL